MNRTRLHIDHVFRDRHTAVVGGLPQQDHVLVIDGKIVGPDAVGPAARHLEMGRERLRSGHDRGGVAHPDRQRIAGHHDDRILAQHRPSILLLHRIRVHIAVAGDHAGGHGHAVGLYRGPGYDQVVTKIGDDRQPDGPDVAIARRKGVGLFNSYHRAQRHRRPVARPHGRPGRNPNLVHVPQRSPVQRYGGRIPQRRCLRIGERPKADRSQARVDDGEGMERGPHQLVDLFERRRDVERGPHQAACAGPVAGQAVVRVGGILRVDELPRGHDVSCMA